MGTAADSHWLVKARGAVYSLAMANGKKTKRSPTAGLLFGLVLTLSAVLLFAYYVTSQFAGLRAAEQHGRPQP